jgi:quercetin dioxygenase-like cupin family protein
MLIAASALTLHASLAQESPTKRIDLQRHDLSIPGREALQVIVEIAPGATAPLHTHPGEEIIYILEGTLEYEIGGKLSRVKTGDVLFVPAGTPHLARNVGTGRGAELATYIVEKGKPLVTPVK